jgi:hypothetical protein
MNAANSELLDGQGRRSGTWRNNSFLCGKLSAKAKPLRRRLASRQVLYLPVARTKARIECTEKRRRTVADAGLRLRASEIEREKTVNKQAVS